MRRNRKQIIEAAKKEKEPAKKNFTFRLDINLMEAFIDSCEKEQAKPTAVLTELMKDFCQYGSKEK